MVARREAGPTVATPSSDKRTERSVPPGFYLLLLFMGIAWGLSLSLAKIASTSGGHPIGLALWQVCVSGLMMFAVSLVTHGPLPIRHDLLRFSLFCGATGVAFPAMALFWCAQYLPAGVVAIAFASMPLFTYLLSVMFGVEQGQRRRLLGVVIGLAAMALLVLPEESLPEVGLTPWVALALVASLSMSVEKLLRGRFQTASGNFNSAKLGAPAWRRSDPHAGGVTNSHHRGSFRAVGQRSMGGDWNRCPQRDRFHGIAVCHSSCRPSVRQSIRLCYYPRGCGVGHAAVWRASLRLHMVRARVDDAGHCAGQAAQTEDASTQPWPGVGGKLTQGAPESFESRQVEIEVPVIGDSILIQYNQ